MTAVTERAPVGNYDSMTFNSPMTDATADRIVAQLAAKTPSRILDIGCGWAELLLRLLAACPAATGHGIDHDDSLIERASAHAADRKLADRVTFSPDVEAATDDESADLVLNLGAEHVFGTLDDALGALRDFVKPGGHLLLGTQFWEALPTPALIESIGELPTLEGLIDRAAATGWRPLDLSVSTPDDWDHFEFGFMRDWEQFVMQPETSEQAALAQRAADEYRPAYFERRGILGFAFLTLGRPADPSRS